MLSLDRRKVERPESKESGNCPNVKNCRSLVYLPTQFFTQTRPKWPKVMSYFRAKTDKKRTLLGCTYLYSSYKGAHRPYKVSASRAGSIETARNVSYHQYTVGAGSGMWRSLVQILLPSTSLIFFCSP